MMHGTGVERTISHRAPIALGLTLVAALAVVGAISLVSSQRATLDVAQADSQGGFPGGPCPGKPMLHCPALPPPPVLPPAQVSCVKSGLKVSSMWPGAYQGLTGESLELANTTDAPCYLTGAPRMKVGTTSGGTESVARGGLASKRVDVQPGEDLFIALGSPGTCAKPAAPDSASSLTLALPGGTMTVSGLRFGVECGAPVLEIFGVSPIPMSAPTTTAGPPSGSGAKSGW